MVIPLLSSDADFRAKAEEAFKLASEALEAPADAFGYGAVGRLASCRHECKKILHLLDEKKLPDDLDKRFALPPISMFRDI